MVLAVLNEDRASAEDHGEEEDTENETWYLFGGYGYESKDDVLGLPLCHFPYENWGRRQSYSKFSSDTQLIVSIRSKEKVMRRMVLRSLLILIASLATNIWPIPTPFYGLPPRSPPLVGVLAFVLMI
jgi:hypothetical protein